MDKFTADDARMLTKSAEEHSPEYEEVIKEIQLQAVNGRTDAFIDHVLSKATIVKLQANGFEVHYGSSISLQKDGYHYKVSWGK